MGIRCSGHLTRLLMVNYLTAELRATRPIKGHGPVDYHISGVATRSAAQILAYGGDSLILRTRRQLDAHAGLVPAERQSGTSVRGKSHLAKQGKSA